MEAADVAVMLAALGCYLMLAGVVRKLLRRTATYKALDQKGRFALLYRICNMAVQLPLGAAEALVLVVPSYHGRDVLYGYSAFAHRVNLWVLAFYSLDTAVLLAGPVLFLNHLAWTAHHLFTVALLAYGALARRQCAAPTAVFLVTAISHPVCELRHVARLFGFRAPVLHTALRVAVVAVSFASGVLPPPYLVVAAAAQRRTGVLTLMRRMRPQCWSVFALFYVPHVCIPLFHIRQLHRHWMLPPRHKAD